MTIAVADTAFDDEKFKSMRNSLPKTHPNPTILTGTNKKLNVRMCNSGLIFPILINCVNFRIDHATEELI